MYSETYKMTSLYYEQCVESPKISTKSLIKLSELQRSFNKNCTVDNSESYLQQLKELINNVRYRRIQLKNHPTFILGSIKSTNWTMELLRVSSTCKDLLLKRSLSEEDLKEKNRTLLRALHMSNACSRYAESILFDTENNRTFKQVNSQYHLSQTLSIAADRFYNMYKYKTNDLAIKRAFQLKELSHVLWKNEEYIKKVVEYRALALLSMARKLDDDECGQKVALLEGIVLKESCPEEVKSQYEKWKQQNESVYYKPVKTEKELNIISLEEAFHILSKCFEGPVS